MITKLTRFILSLMGMRPLLFSDKAFWTLSIIGIRKRLECLHSESATLKVPLLSLHIISIKTVVSPVKDQCPKKIPDNCKYMYLSYHIERSGSPVRGLSCCEWCRNEGRNPGETKCAEGIKKPHSKARFIVLIMSNQHIDDH